MKKMFKRIAITLAVLLFLLLAAIGGVVWFVFTPERLTPIVRTQAAKYITCQTEIGEVELTFFSTFPRFGLKVNRFVLVNPTPNAPSDTLVSIGELVGVVDVAAWWNRNEIVLTELHMNNGHVNAFIDSLGHTNFDIMKADTTTVPVDTAQAAMPFSFINISDVEFNNVSLSFADQSQKLHAGVQNLTAQFSGSFASDTVNTEMKMSDGKVSFGFAGESYMKDVAIKFDVPAQIILSRMFVKFDGAEASVNDLAFELTGSVENDTINKKIHTNITYETKEWSIPAILALVPPSFQSYLKGLEVDGVVSSKGKITGAYSERSMPLMDIQVAMEDGSLKYSGLPLPLSEMKGDISLYTDLSNDTTSYLRINSFSAKTPQSSFSTSGSVTHLFSDISINLTSKADLVLAEFKPLLPKDMKVKMAGEVSGTVKSAFTMSQMEKMQIEKMKLSGSIAASDLDVAYDSLMLKTESSTIDFALPNPNKLAKNARFVYAKIVSSNLNASKLAGFSAFLENATLSLEASDVRDTTRIPNVACTFSLDTLAAAMDTMTVSIRKPVGQFTMLPQKGKPSNPQIMLTYSCDALNAAMGSSYARMRKANLTADIQDDKVQPRYKITYGGEDLGMGMGEYSAKIAKIYLKANVVNNTKEKDVFQQWATNGFVDMENGVINMASMRYPFEIPAIKMDFDPETFKIKESKLKIDRSDFSLAGTLSNVLSYFKSDSLLRGDFDFVSKNTDVLQLMSLTNGVGYEEKPAPTDTATSSGPYMVPKGIDIVLRTNVSKAILGLNTITDITGEMRVKDGLLIMDKYRFTTPASKMQLTVMYRTPRKNHIFLGLDYHMLNIEIGTLLKMIPDIDTIMPMLRSFKGQGEFHIAAEMYTDSLYKPKKSTIRAASSIKGHNLVLMDGSTFSTIAKNLRFNKKTENKVDSLSAEFTVFKQEIDIYPFLIVMDKYKAVVEGRHNFDMSFNYHISVVDCPLPIKLGLDVAGNMEKLNYNLVKCKYGDLYRPTARGTVQERQLELRRRIRESLTQKVVKE